MTEGRESLKRRVLTKYFMCILIVGAMLFLPAGSFRYWEAWIFCAILFLPMGFLGFYLYKNDPDLLERRLKSGEKEKQQQRMSRLAAPFYFLAFLIPGFDHRFGWSEVPVWLVLAANASIFLGTILFMLVLRENSFAARTVQVEEGQKAIDSGPYSRIRHPMYLGVGLIHLALSLALGTFWALPIFGLIPVYLVLRIRNEEEVMRRELPGYKEYCGKVRYRLIPRIW